MQKLIRAAGMVLADAALINISYLFALLLRFDFSLKAAGAEPLLAVYGRWWILLTVLKLVIFAAMGMYSSLWEYAGSGEYARATGGILLGNLAAAILLWVVGGLFPPGLLVLVMLLDLLLLTTCRGIYYYLPQFRARRLPKAGEDESGRRAMIVGADFTARDLIREMKLKRGTVVYTPVAVVAGDRDVTGTRLEGLKITGTRRDIARLARKNKITDIFITIPTTEVEELSAVRKECQRTSCRVWHLPGLYDVMDGRVDMRRHSLSLEEVEHLMGGGDVSLNRRQIAGCFRGKIVMITGAGSAIGRELCRQAAAFGPRTILAVDPSERELLRLEEQMKRDFSDTGFAAAPAEVGDPDRVMEIFEKYTPHIVLHNAFYRDPSTAENHLREVIFRNVFGTANVVRACERVAAERFVMVSSDRANDQATALGATFRAAEILVQHRRSPKTLYACVRMGDTVYDPDSGIREMIRRIEENGPVELAHEDGARVFSSLPGSVKLVLQAAAMAQGGEIFAMKNGQKVRLKDLAERIIRAYGLKPYEQIPVVFAGKEEDPDKDEPLPAEKKPGRETSNPLLILSEEERTEDSPRPMDVEALKEVPYRVGEEELKKELLGLVKQQ